MPEFKPAKLLRVLCSEADKYKGKALFTAVVDKCLEMKIAGATVFRGAEGYGESAEIHRGRLLTHNLPIVVTVVDSAEAIGRLVAVLEEMIDTGLIAISDVEAYRVVKTAPASTP